MLQQAAAIIAERGAAYGDAAASMSAVAARWSITLGYPVTPAQVVLCMIDLKLARLAHDPNITEDAAAGRTAVIADDTAYGDTTSHAPRSPRSSITRCIDTAQVSPVVIDSLTQLHDEASIAQQMFLGSPLLPE